MSGILLRCRIVVDIHIVGNGWVEGKLEVCVPEREVLKTMGEGLARGMFLKEKEASLTYWPLFYFSDL